MINYAGNAVSPTADSLQISAIDRGTHSDLTIYNDFSNTLSTFGYSIAASINLLYNQQQYRTTCEAKLQLLQFVEWFMTSSAVSSLAGTVGLINSIVNRASNVPSIQMFCNSKLLQIQSTDTGTLRGSTAISTYLKAVLSFYQSFDNTRTYVQEPADQFDALAQLTGGEIDIAILQPDLLNNTDSQLYTQYVTSGDVNIIPTAITAVRPIYHLPDIIQSLNQSLFDHPMWGNNIYGQPGLTIDMITLSAIYTGNINDWTHPNISQYTPWLAERIQHLQSQNSSIQLPITLIICCTSLAADTTATQILAYGFHTALSSSVYTTQIDRAAVDTTQSISNTYDRWSLPYSWYNNLTQLGNNIKYEFVAAEEQHDESTTLTDCAISYYITAYYVTTTNNVQREFVLLYNTITDRYTADDVKFGTVNSSMACIQPQSNTNINYFSLQLTSALQSTCWPFSSLVSLAVMSHYEDSFPIAISTVNKTLNMLQWLISTDNLQYSAHANYLGWMNTAKQYNNVSIHTVNYITCNGENCLITLPTYWSVTNGVQVFSYIISSVMIILCMISAVIIWSYRRRVVIRSSSVIFLEVMLLGISLLYLSAIILVQSPTLGSCSTFAWFCTFGLQLTFVPLFMKMYRIYKIFSRKQLKIVKLTDLRLLSYMGVLLLFDIVVMSAWQSSAPLQPLTTHVYSGVNDRQYLQCNLTGGGATYVVIIGIEKAMLLLFGCVMSFSTRKVSGTFNESTSVAWSIYNTILATVIVIPIIVFVHALGDTLIILVLIMILWIGVSIYGFIIGTKLYTLMQGEANEQISQLESNRTVSGGFSFVSVDALSVHTIDTYLKALKSHLTSVQQKKLQLTKNTDCQTKSRVNDVVSPTSHVSMADSIHSCKQSHDLASATEPVTHNKRQSSYQITSSQYQHETIAAVRRETPSFVHRTNSYGGLVGSNILQNRKLSNTNIRVISPTNVELRNNNQFINNNTTNNSTSSTDTNKLLINASTDTNVNG